MLSAVCSVITQSSCQYTHQGPRSSCSAELLIRSVGCLRFVVLQLLRVLVLSGFRTKKLLRRKQQTSVLLRTNNTIVKDLFKFMLLLSVLFHQSCPSFDGMRRRQHKPPSSPEQRIFPLIFIATIRQIFGLLPLLLMCIWGQFFPSWIPFEQSNFSLRLQPHSLIEPDWSDLRDLNFDYTIQCFQELVV